MLVKFERRKTAEEIHQQKVLAYWLLFLRAPGRETLPGEPVDLQEIGTVPEKSWSRDTPYSVAQPNR